MDVVDEHRRGDPHRCEPFDDPTVAGRQGGAVVPYRRGRASSVRRTAGCRRLQAIGEVEEVVEQPAGVVVGVVEGEPARRVSAVAARRLGLHEHRGLAVPRRGLEHDDARLVRRRGEEPPEQVPPGDGVPVSFGYGELVICGPASRPGSGLGP
ncbi:hypothetical protein ACVGOW_04110 [Pseudonocardia saturnea]